MRKILCILLCLSFCHLPAYVRAEIVTPTISARASLLMEASTGRVLHESHAHEPLPPASVTKIMTMLLVMEAVDAGQIALSDTVTASENAKRMGGSTIYLDTGEQMTVHDLMKGIAVASGNDACVAMAEYLCGTEEAFVARMNTRAAELGMINTHFINCNGLPADGHVTSAYDIALMTRALLTHPQIFTFTTIWVDSLRGGKFGLANTNKLIRFYEGANGMKTGSTDEALYCLSATAKRDDMQLIAVILGAPSTKERFDGARALLDFGFANYTIAMPDDRDKAVATVSVEKGMESTVRLAYTEVPTVLLEKEKLSRIETRTQIPESCPAPIRAGDPIGSVQFWADGALLCEIALAACSDVPRKTFPRAFAELFSLWCNK